MAQKISEIRAALAELQESHEQVANDLETLVTLARRQHDDTHPGVFQYCQNPVCHHASRVGYDPGVRDFL